jgi:hypothetical protein
MAPRRRPLLGHLMIKEGLITRAQLDQALQTQAEQKAYVPFEQILVAQQGITPAQLNAVLDKYHKRYRLGAILVEMKAITEEQLRQALQQQQKTGVRLGDALLRMNLVSERQLRHALCRQFDVTFVDLDTMSPDAGVLRLVPRSYAEQHRIIPIARVENRLTVAMDDPADVDVVDELAAATGCEIDVVTSGGAAFQRAFLRAYGDSRSPATPVPSPGGAERRLPRPADATRELDELRRAHAAVQAERDAAVAALEAARAALAEERARTAKLVQELETIRRP